MQKNDLEDIKFERASIGRERVTLRRRLLSLERATTLHAQSFLVRRWRNLQQVRTPMLLWIACAGLFIAIGWSQVLAQQPLYSHKDTISGGAYIEGAVGEVDTLNPIFATNVAERSLSKLLFAGLLNVDKLGEPTAGLAEKWTVSSDGRVYTLVLRKDLNWTDGKPITTKDILFTIDAIQTPASRSPLLGAWRNIKVEAKDDRTAVFMLGAPYAPFLNTLTVGILPSHVLSNVRPEQLKGTSFNSQPSVTSGPFSYRGTVEGKGGSRSRADVYLTRNDDYHSGKAKLERYTMRVYEDGDALASAMREREIMAAYDVPHNAIEDLKTENELKVSEKELFSGVFSFFKTSAPPLDDKRVRQALKLGSDVRHLTGQVGDVLPMQGPLLAGQLGFNEALQQKTGDAEAANKLLDEAGWRREGDGIRVKEGKPLKLRVVSLNSGEYSTVTQILQKQWRQIGVDSEVSLVQQEEFQSNVITPHAYDVLVYELAIGRDSDVYAFWHSSQAEPGRLNLSEYKSALADEALDSGRTAIDNRLRDIKYQAFVEQWLSDTPAIALYRPNLYYVQLAKTQSVGEGEIGDALERFSDVLYWTVETGDVDDTR